MYNRIIISNTLKAKPACYVYSGGYRWFMQKICPVCKDPNKTEKDFYRKDKTRLATYYCMARWIARKIQFIGEMGNKCQDCAGSFHYAAYDFHHLRDKEFEWTKMRLRSEAAIRKELTKCILLCSNCHRVRHARLDSNQRSGSPQAA